MAASHKKKVSVVPHLYEAPLSARRVVESSHDPTALKDGDVFDAVKDLCQTEMLPSVLQELTCIVEKLDYFSKDKKEAHVLRPTLVRQQSSLSRKGSTTPSTHTAAAKRSRTWSRKANRRASSNLQSTIAALAQSLHFMDVNGNSGDAPSSSVDERGVDDIDLNFSIDELNQSLDEHASRYLGSPLNLASPSSHERAPSMTHEAGVLMVAPQTPRRSVELSTPATIRDDYQRLKAKKKTDNQRAPVAVATPPVPPRRRRSHQKVASPASATPVQETQQSDCKKEPEEQFGKGKIPSHYRSPTFDQFDKLLTPNSKRLSSAQDCSALFARFISERSATKQREKLSSPPPLSAVQEDTSDNATESKYSTQRKLAYDIPTSRDKNRRLEQDMIQSKEQKRKDTKTKMTREILETETTYVRSLEVLMRLFVRPLKEPALQKTLGLRQKQYTRLFANIEMIAYLHQQFLKRLLEGFMNGNLELFETFMTNADFLKIYTDFASKFDTHTLRTLKRLETNKRFQSWLSKVHQDKSLRGRLMSDLLIMPIQRIPRYEMLLHGIKELTNPDDDEFKTLDTACQKLSKIAHHVNENKRLIENMDTMVKIQKQLKWNCTLELMQPHRRFLRTVSCNRLSEHAFKRSKKKPSLVYMFNDLLVWTNKQKAVRGVMYLRWTEVSSRSSVGNVVCVHLKCNPPQQWLQSFRDRKQPLRSDVRFEFNVPGEADIFSNLVESCLNSFVSSKENILVGPEAQSAACEV